MKRELNNARRRALARCGVRVDRHFVRRQWFVRAHIAEGWTDRQVNRENTAREVVRGLGLVPVCSRYNTEATAYRWALVWALEVPDDIDPDDAREVFVDQLLEAFEKLNS